MNKNILILVSVFFSASLLGQAMPSEYNGLIRVADSLYLEKNYKNSVAAYSEAFKTKGWRGRAQDRYNAARAWSMLNVPDSAFFALSRITDNLYFSNEDKITKEEAFWSLHTDSRWLPLIERIKKNKLPIGWVRKETVPLSYRMVFVDSVGKTGGKAGTVKSIVPAPPGIGNLMQKFSAEKYKNKRVRMTGYMRSENVKEWAAFWMRVDQPNSKESLAFDNMHDGVTNRSIVGTTDWKQYEIVLDVPESASNIVFGAFLRGEGQIWFENMKFEVVDKKVPVTGINKTEPNLDFNK